MCVYPSTPHSSLCESCRRSGGAQSPAPFSPPLPAWTPWSQRSQCSRRVLYTGCIPSPTPSLVLPADWPLGGSSPLEGLVKQGINRLTVFTRASSMAVDPASRLLPPPPSVPLSVVSHCWLPLFVNAAARCALSACPVPRFVHHCTHDPRLQRRTLLDQYPTCLRPRPFPSGTECNSKTLSPSLLSVSSIWVVRWCAVSAFGDLGILLLSACAC